MKVFHYFLLVIGFGLGSCAVSKVNTEADPATNLNVYHTFKFTDHDNLGNPNPLYHNSMIDNSIHAQIAIELEKRGIIENVDNPALFIAYHTYTEKKRSSVNNYYPMMYGGWGWGYYPWGFNPYPYGYWGGYTSTYVYTEGTLIVDVIDAKSKQLVWRGSISDVINSPNDLHRKATRAVELIFKKFPVKPGHHDGTDEKPLARKNMDR